MTMESLKTTISPLCMCLRGSKDALEACVTLEIRSIPGNQVRRYFCREYEEEDEKLD
jgi:hypothetical protein